MEYCKYGSIQDYLTNGNHLIEQELRDVTSCCLLGLDYLHNENIIHSVFYFSNSFTNRISSQRICSFPSIS